MKSRVDHDQLTPVENDHLDRADLLLADSQRSGERLPKPVRPPSAVDATLLTLIGWCALAVGVTLIAGPRLSWKLGQIADACKDLGVHGGVLIVGGAILAALGKLRRGQHALRTPTTEQAEDRMLIEQLTRDSLRAAEVLARLESGLAHVEAELANSRRVLDERIGQTVGQVVAAIPPPPPPASPDEAIFRLAASLDQVGMRIEQRLKTQYTALQDHIEDVGAAILSARNQMMGLQKTGEDHAAALREEVQAQVESALEETGFRVHERRGPSLGVLDTLDESGDHDQRDLGEIESALPINPEEAREHGAATGNPLSMITNDTDAKTRLIQLSTLLADPKLRKALEGIRNS